jgi:hypothetical protein
MVDRGIIRVQANVGGMLPLLAPIRGFMGKRDGDSMRRWFFEG